MIQFVVLGVIGVVGLGRALNAQGMLPGGAVGIVICRTDEPMIRFDCEGRIEFRAEADNLVIAVGERVAVKCAGPLAVVPKPRFPLFQVNLDETFIERFEVDDLAGDERAGARHETDQGEKQPRS